MSQSALPKTKSFPPAKQRRLDQLLEKNSNGTINTKDKAKLEALVAEAEELMVANSQRLADFARRQAHQSQVTAAPVTVWVIPQLAGWLALE
jgi:hypothetical protein